MVTGWMLSTGTDTKGRRLLYIKKDNTYYLLPQNREFAITLWKHAEINAISISIILGYFLFHNIAGTVLLALALYAAVLLAMNKKLLPSLHRAGGRNITWRKEKPAKEGNSMLMAVLFLLIGVGLFLCLALEQTQNTLETVTAAAGGCIALFVGARQLYRNKMIRK